jgi:hypothetical protein
MNLAFELSPTKRIIVDVRALREASPDVLHIALENWAWLLRTLASVQSVAFVVTVRDLLALMDKAPANVQKIWFEVDRSTREPAPSIGWA